MQSQQTQINARKRTACWDCDVIEVARQAQCKEVKNIKRIGSNEKKNGIELGFPAPATSPLEMIPGLWSC